MRDFPEQDRALAEFAFEASEVVLAAYGHLPPFCIIENDTGDRFTLRQDVGFADQETKHEFFVLCRVAATSVLGCRAVVIGESWRVDGRDPLIRAEAVRLHAENRLHEMPGVRDCVTAMLESDDGRGALTRDLDKSQTGWITLKPLSLEDARFDPWTDPDAAKGVFGDGMILMPREERKNLVEEAIQFLKQARVRCQSMTEYLSVVKGITPQA